MLVVAGSLKRAELSVAEDNILMRALRDFNLPKIATEDVAVFMGLIGDLFPGITVDRKRDMVLEEKILKVMVRRPLLLCVFCVSARLASSVPLIRSSLVAGLRA